MNASKESCREARKCLDEMVATRGQDPLAAPVIYAFLAAAERKLPNERAYKRENRRSKR